MKGVTNIRDVNITDALREKFEREGKPGDCIRDKAEPLFALSINRAGRLMLRHPGGPGSESAVAAKRDSVATLRARVVAGWERAAQRRETTERDASERARIGAEIDDAVKEVANALRRLADAILAARGADV